MKRTFSALACALLAFWAGGADAQTFTPQVTQTVGSGSNVSYFVINFEDGPNGTNAPASDYVFAYRWNYNGSAAPTGGDMLDTLSSQADPAFSVTYSPGYTTKPNRFIQAFIYAGHSQAGYSNPDQSYGYWAYWLSDGARLSQNNQDWDYSGVGIDGRTLAPDSYDGWTFATDQATPVPVTPAAAPEPGATCVLSMGAGCVAVLAWRRRRQA